MFVAVVSFVQRFDPIDTASEVAERASTPPHITAAADFAYDGAPGRTRREPLLVTMPGGVLKSVPAHRVVNVGTDPDLREPALAGSLHRFERGGALAIPFVYHDPMARKFALVLPPSLRHRELAERARLLDELQADAEHPIPAYVRHFAVVVGLEELDAYLALPPAPASPVEAARRAASLDERAQRLEHWEADLAVRERAVAQQEARLRRQVEDLEAREAQLRTQPDPLAASATPVHETLADAELVGDDEVEDVSAFDDVDASEVQELSADPAEEVTEVSELDVEPVEPDAGPVAGLDDPTTRGSAALALAQEGGADTLDDLFAVLGQLTPEELVAVLGALCARGELATDHLMQALGAPEPYVRHGAVLALGAVDARGAISALLQVVRNEPEDLWQEAARVLGHFQLPAFQAVTQVLEEGLPGREERFAYALAALAVQGCDEELAALRSSSDATVAKVAREAMTLRPVVQAHQEVVDGEAAADPADRIREFSQRFVRVLRAVPGAPPTA